MALNNPVQGLISTSWSRKLVIFKLPTENNNENDTKTTATLKFNYETASIEDALNKLVFQVGTVCDITDY